MRALARRGLAIAAAKNGPDYIDPAFHAAATGRASVNLDSWAMAPDLLRGLAGAAAAGADLLVVEGSMGLFDGVAAPPRRTGASADLAASLGLPVLLVLDVSGQAQTAAAVALGCARLDPEVAIAGVILNRVASARHERLVAEAMRAQGFAVLGALPRNDALVLPERHLGLVQAASCRRSPPRSTRSPISSRPMSISTRCWPPRGRSRSQRDRTSRRCRRRGSASRWRATPPSRSSTRIFSTAGARRAPRSPSSPRWPTRRPTRDADCCWLPGGYPELHADTLAAARRFQAGMRAFAETRPVHGECGGYMVLGRTLTDKDDRTHDDARRCSRHATSFATTQAASRLPHRHARGTTAASDRDVARVLKRPRVPLRDGVGRERYAVRAEPARRGQGRATRYLPAAGAGLVSGSFFHAIAIEA